jgi:hypothetical protein
MPIDFTNTVGFAAALAREHMLQQARAQAQALQQQDISGEQSAYQNATNLTMQDRLKADALAHEQAYKEAVTAGQEAGMAGRPTPQYTTDETNRGAMTGAAAGRMAMAQFLAKNKAEMEKVGAQARNAHDLETYRHQLTLDPETQRLMMERIMARNKGAKEAALAGNPALTTAAQTQADKDVMHGAGRLQDIHNARAQLDTFTDADFGAAGGAKDWLMRKRRLIQNVPGLHWTALSPDEQKQLGRNDLWRASISRTINSLLKDDAGKAVTDNEWQRKKQELGIMFDSGSMFNSKAEMNTALALTEELETQLQQYRQDARRGDVRSTVNGAGTQAPVAGQSPDQISFDETDTEPEAANTQEQTPETYDEWMTRNKFSKEDPTYDYQRAFVAGVGAGSNGHFPDTYKTPVHPTFSDESSYNGQGGKQGGHWEALPDDTYAFHASDWNLQNTPEANLKAYFDKYEPGNTLVLPSGEAYIGKAGRDEPTPRAAPAKKQGGGQTWSPKLISIIDKYKTPEAMAKAVEEWGPAAQAAGVPLDEIARLLRRLGLKK